MENKEGELINRMVGKGTKVVKVILIKGFQFVIWNQEKKTRASTVTNTSVIGST